MTSDEIRKALNEATKPEALTKAAWQAHDAVKALEHSNRVLTEALAAAKARSVEVETIWDRDFRAHSASGEWSLDEAARLADAMADLRDVRRDKDDSAGGHDQG
jgi:hypothetical protein